MREWSTSSGKHASDAVDDAGLVGNKDGDDVLLLTLLQRLLGGIDIKVLTATTHASLCDTEHDTLMLSSTATHDSLYDTVQDALMLSPSEATTIAPLAKTPDSA